MDRAGLRARIRELRQKHAGIDDAPYDPGQLVDELAAEVRRAGVATPGLPAIPRMAGRVLAAILGDGTGELARQRHRAFHDALDLLEAALAGQAAANAESGDATAPTRTRRGRPKADYETIQREAQVAADWERAREAGTYKGDFAKQCGMKVSQLDKLLARVRKRKSRAE